MTLDRFRKHDATSKTMQNDVVVYYINLFAVFRTSFWRLTRPIQNVTGQIYKNRYAPRTCDYRSVCMDCKTTILQLMVCVACGVSWIYLVDSGCVAVKFLALDQNVEKRSKILTMTI